jgi:membrane protein CcdC involved in cytochrome C biogenesis
MDVQTQIRLSYALTAIVMAVILWFRFRSMAKVRPLKPARLWVLPALYTLFTGYFFTTFPPAPQGWVFASIALLIGIQLGWWRGKMMQIMVDPQTHALTQKASPAAMIFIALLIIARLGSRMFMGADAQEGGLHGTTLLVTDALIGMALGFLVAQRLEMYLRAKRLLAQG